MKPVFTGVHSVNWYLKYVGLPITVGVAIYALFTQLANKRRRAALRGKVRLFCFKMTVKCTLDFGPYIYYYL